MAKGSKPRTPKQAQVERIRSIVRGAEKRGYQFPKGFSAKSLARKSLAKLKEFTPEKVYAKAKYTTKEGKTISGTEARKIERSIASKKGAVTKAYKKEAEKQFWGGEGDTRYYGEDAFIPPQEYLEENFLMRSEQAYNEMMELISRTEIDDKHHLVGIYIREKVEDEIAIYSKSVVMQAVEDNPAVIEKLQKVIEYYKPSQEGFEGAFDTFLTMLSGGLVRAQKELDELNDLFANLDSI